MFSGARSAAAFAALLLLLGAACSEATDPGARLPRVVIVSIDGLRPDAIAATNAPNLQRLVREGSTALNALTAVPSNTLPVHTSMVTGLIPSRHGILWNDDTTSRAEPVAATTIFDLARSAGLTTAMFVGKSKLSNIVHAGAPTFVSLPPVNEFWLAERVRVNVMTYLQQADPLPSLMLIHLADVDLKGHVFGWMSAEYLGAVRQADAVLGNLLTGLQQAFGDNLVLIVTADHGGSGTSHGDGSVQSTTIPWIVWGSSVRTQTLASQIRVVDTAPTVLHLLDIAIPSGWDGADRRAAFEAPTTAGTR